MFPFTLPGPLFLVFYALFAAAVLAAYLIYSAIAHRGRKPRLSELTADPYRIAFLREGEEETVRLAIVNLVDRGLLFFTIATVRARPGSLDFVRRPLDRAILAGCAEPRDPKNIHHYPAVRAACQQYQDELAAAGVLLDKSALEARRNTYLAVLGILGGVAAARAVQALIHVQALILGQTNLLPLLFLAALACWLASHIHDGARITSAGRQVLSSIETLTQRVKWQAGRLSSGGATNEALLHAATFGIYALPHSAFGFVEQLFPKPVETPMSSSGDGDSWFSLSCGGSCGGGCGGCGG